MNAPHRPVAKISAAEFEAMARRGAFKDMRVELRRGMISKMSPVYYPHGSAASLLYQAVIAGLGQSGLAWAAVFETSVQMSTDFEPVADIVVFDPAAIPQGLQGPIPKDAIKLVIEVAHTSITDDMGEKRDDYAAAGVAEYWVADVAARVVYLHAAAQDGAFKSESKAPFGARFAFLTHPSLHIDTGALA